MDLPKEHITDGEENVSIPKSLIVEFVHEIRNPLALIKGTVQLAKLKQKDVESKYYDKIAVEVERLNQMIDEFVVLARAQKPQTQILLNGILPQVVGMLHAELKSQVPVEIELCSEEVWVVADENQLKLVLFNLARSSIQAMQGEGVLHLELKVIAGGLAQVLLRDTGSREAAGGLHLTVCQQIVADYQGSLSVKKNSNDGYTYYMHIPLVETVQHSEVAGG